MLSNIRKFYHEETMKQIYKIIGSLDFVGNPTMLLSSVFAGFKDLFLAPSSAFLQSPTDPSSVGVGVAKGTLSFFSHSTSGFFAFCTKVSAAASQFAANLSLDSKFSDWHRESVIVEATNIQRQWKKRGVNEVGSTLFRPIQDILGGFGGAIFYFFFAPIDGLRERGVPGLLSGLAVGVTGVVARPIVGILDAIVHISASVHDIARSVNILEKRFQPAMRVRLAYAFGFMNILMHYESSVSHADALIKRYPLRQRRWSIPIPCEFVVHVEVLPDSDNDATYAIITNARILLLKLKKGQSDRSTPLLYWELLLDEKPNISSEVVDHGHSGVAFTIKVKSQKPNQAHYGGLRPPRKVFSSPDLMRFQSKIRRRTRPLFSMDDDNIAKNELEAESQIYPDRQEDENIDGESDDENEVENEELRADTANDFDHYTKMDTEGEVVECFSILAEYQFRRQLGRLHNALCCVLGNFDSIMRDPDIGFHGHRSQEGYTVFGIYRFSPDSLTSNTGEHELPKVLENLPWVSDSLFETYSNLPASQQQEAVARERQSMDDATCLRASAEVGGATWLIQARAWALSLENKDDEDVDMQSLSDSTESEKSGDFGSNVDLFSSARATFDQINDQDETMLGKLASCTSIQNEGDTSERLKLSDSIMIPTKFIPGRCSNRISSVSEGSCTSIQSLGASFATANEDIPTITSSGSVESHGSHRKEKRVTDDLSDAVSAERVSASPSTQRREFGPTSTPINQADRMGRMESLMEQLLSFSAEQTMMRERELTQSRLQDFTALRQELRELKDELRKKSALDSSLEEVAKLREEVAWLKQRLDQKDALEGDTNQNSSNLQENRRKRFSFRSLSSAKGEYKDRSDQADTK
ncbi:hypothetical protein FisN_13Lu043 [Fistulifera solaris]|uniref:Uncharacterized protein n=1 Tax=Fistulifera solaris TaxID=1519565 RepID=A0A1Z5JFA7_FISSO|nr:hypothetical protein FisN_13Lu043 [Fistulifera solaris]|eukprot:GAX12582.1 hypothetical protein FisN_13Lu043 [Fistulifera solaris]